MSKKHSAAILLLEKMHDEFYVLREHHLEKHREAISRKNSEMIEFHKSAASAYMSAISDLQMYIARLQNA